MGRSRTLLATSHSSCALSPSPLAVAVSPPPPLSSDTMADDDDGTLRPEDDYDDADENEGSFQAALQSRSSAVQGKLNSGQTQAALVEALANPPLGTKDDGIKEESAQIVGMVLAAVKDADIKKHVDALDDFQLDTLTKYVYRCMIHSEDSKKLLAWHAACVEKGGLGTIMRAFAERKT